MKKIFKILNSPFGSWLKVFVLAVAAQISIAMENGTDIMTMDWPMAKRFLITAFLSLLAPAVNSKNPLDIRYGNKPKAEDFPPEQNKIKE